MKTLVPCCEPADMACEPYIDGHGSVSISVGCGDSYAHDVKFCPWCGKRFEVV